MPDFFASSLVSRNPRPKLCKIFFEHLFLLQKRIKISIEFRSKFQRLHQCSRNSHPKWLLAPKWTTSWWALGGYLLNSKQRIGPSMIGFFFHHGWNGIPKSFHFGPQNVDFPAFKSPSSLMHATRDCRYNFTVFYSLFSARRPFLRFLRFLVGFLR